MATKQPVRSGYDVFLKDLLALFGGASILTSGTPYGGYSGGFSSTVSEANPIVTNPYGVTSQVRYTGVNDRGGFKGARSIDLRAGQSYNFITGQLSDPNLHANTARRLNEALQYRTVNSAGLDQATKTTARESTSVLASLDEMYLGNASTEVTTSEALTNLSQVKQQGFNTSSAKTVLGTEAKTAASKSKTPLKRALT